MKRFKRELRYVVLKRTDIEASLTDTEIRILNELTDKVSLDRFNRSKKELACVVVESDWPEYEPVWKMIEDRMKEGGE